MAKDTPRPRKIDPPAPAPGPSAEAPTRMSFTLDKDGLPDWDRMHERTRSQLRTILDKTRPPSLPGSGASAVDLVSPQLCASMLDSLSPMIVAMTARRYRVPIDVARVMAFDEADKRALAPSLAAIANKYGGPLFLKFGDEIQLCMALVAVLNAKTLLLKMAIERDRGDRGPAPVVPFPQAQVETESQEGKTSNSDENA